MEKNILFPREVTLWKIALKISDCIYSYLDIFFSTLSGTKVTEQVLLLVSTLIVLLCVLITLRPEFFPMDFSNSQACFAVFFEGLSSLEKLKTSLPAQIGSHVEQTVMAMKFFENQDKLYPLIYSTLELGHSWETVVAEMLEMHEAQGSLKKLEDTPAWSLWDKYSFTDVQKELLVPSS